MKFDYENYPYINRELIKKEVYRWVKVLMYV